MRTPFEEVFNMYTDVSVILKGVVDEPICVDMYNNITGQVSYSVGIAVHNDVEDVIDE